MSRRVDELNEVLKNTFIGNVAQLDTHNAIMLEEIAKSLAVIADNTSRICTLGIDVKVED